jgi:putative transposase
MLELSVKLFRQEGSRIIETFNGSFRDGCLNVHWFESLEEAREKIETWRIDYNDSRRMLSVGRVSL